MNISSISDAIQPTFRGRLKLACKQISHLKTPTRKIELKNTFLICDLCGGAHEDDEPKIYRHGETTNIKKGEDSPEWVVKNKFEDEHANFILEKKFHTNGIGEMLDQHHKEMHEQFSQILSTIEENKFTESEEPTFAITTRSGISTRDPPFLALSQLTPANQANRTTEKEVPKGAESSIQDEEVP
ncbi:hypothetical protein Tco_0417670 [Tanacetum coccineum]